MKSLGSKDDVTASRDAVQESEGRTYLGIPDSRTPWYILSLDYVDGFNHWVNIPGGRREKVVCMGDPVEDGDWAPDDCLICARRLEMYDMVKELTGKAATDLKKEANDMRAKHEVHLIAIRGVRILTKDAKGQKRYVADFDLEDEESTTEVGVMTLTHAQWVSLTDLVDDENIEHIKDGEDLANRILWTEKKKKNKKNRFKEVFWTAEKRKSEPPCELPDLDISEDFEQDAEKTQKVYDLLINSDNEGVGEDEEVDMEEDSYDEDIDDDYLADVEDEVDEESYEDDEIEEEPEEVEHEEFEDDIPGEDEIEDDEPEVIEEPEPKPKPKPRTRSTSAGKKPAAKRPAAKKPAAKKGTTTRKPAARKPASSRAKSGKKNL